KFHRRHRTRGGPSVVRTIHVGGIAERHTESSARRTGGTNGIDGDRPDAAVDLDFERHERRPSTRAACRHAPPSETAGSADARWARKYAASAVAMAASRSSVSDAATNGCPARVAST